MITTCTKCRNEIVKTMPCDCLSDEDFLVEMSDAICTRLGWGIGFAKDDNLQGIILGESEYINRVVEAVDKESN